MKTKRKKFRLKRTRAQLLYDQFEILTPTVASVLMEDKLSRDDDNRLCILTWKKQGMKENESFKSFKFKLIMNKLATPESIGRVRRTLQERDEKYRGLIYKFRHDAEEKYIRNQLKLF